MGAQPKSWGSWEDPTSGRLAPGTRVTLGHPPWTWLIPSAQQATCYHTFPPTLSKKPLNADALVSLSHTSASAELCGFPPFFFFFFFCGALNFKSQHLLNHTSIIHELIPVPGSLNHHGVHGPQIQEVSSKCCSPGTATSCNLSELNAEY